MLVMYLAYVKVLLPVAASSLSSNSLSGQRWLLRPIKLILDRHLLTFVFGIFGGAGAIAIDPAAAGAPQCYKFVCIIYAVLS